MLWWGSVGGGGGGVDAWWGLVPSPGWIVWVARMDGVGHIGIGSALKVHCVEGNDGIVQGPTMQILGPMLPGVGLGGGHVSPLSGFAPAPMVHRVASHDALCWSPWAWVGP